MRDRLNLALVLTAALTITYFSFTSIRTPVPAGTFSLLHLVAYFGLTAALLLYFHDTEKGHLEAVLVAGCFGLVIELVQYNLPYRSFTLKDVTVNFLGASIVLLDHKVGIVTRAVNLEEKVLETVLN